MKSAPLRMSVPLLVGLGAFVMAGSARADSTLTLDGNVPPDGPDHFYVPFEVPAGTQEIEILHTDESDQNILDWGLYDQSGSWRGYGGGNSENAIVGVSASSRSYMTGAIAAGTWKVDVGKAKVVASPAVYHIVVTLRTAPTLPPQTERKPYAPAAALTTGARYYAGDLHVHSKESGDATPSLDEVGTFALSRGLDFVELSDHNTVTQDDFIVDAQSRFAKLLFIPGIEFTTYKGHANAIGATRWVDHKIGLDGATIDGSVDAIAAQGAIFSINHPMLDLGNLCIGCAWKHDVATSKIFAVEIETGGLSSSGLLFQPQTIALWEKYLAEGAHVVGLGGGDDHRAGKETGSFQSAMGSPTTLVYATELSAAAILDGVRKGHVVVKTDQPNDPMVELTAGDALPGDALKQKTAVLKAKVSGLDMVNHTITGRWVHNGVAEDELPITTEGQILEKDVQAPATGEDRWRFEVLFEGAKIHTITNHVFLAFDAAGPDPVPPAQGGGSGSPGAKGCTVHTSPDGGSRSDGAALGVVIAVAAVGARRARRRP